VEKKVNILVGPGQFDIKIHLCQNIKKKLILLLLEISLPKGGVEIGLMSPMPQVKKLLILYLTILNWIGAAFPGDRTQHLIVTPK